MNWRIKNLKKFSRNKAVMSIPNTKRYNNPLPSDEEERGFMIPNHKREYASKK